VRTDVWNNLKHLEDLDKWEQYIIEINWSRSNLRSMLSKRIVSYIQRTHPECSESNFDYKRDYSEIFNLIFFPTIQWGNKLREPFVPIQILSNKRPRWMGQLCRMAAKQAHKSHSRLVNKDHINEILETFGKFRKNDLIKEHRHQFEHLDRLIDAFRAKSREYKLTDLNQLISQNYIFRVGALNIPKIDGEIYQSPMQLGAFLYKIGFLSHSHGDKVTFTHFYQDPDLFQTQGNEKDELMWAVHPSYRRYLNIR
jgi:hypothetical protein